MNLIRGLFFLLILIFWSEKSFGQRVRANASVNTITHATCYGAQGNTSVGFSLVGVPAGTVIGGYTLVISKDGVYYATLSSSVIQSTTNITVPINGLYTGEYSISGTLSAYNTSTSSMTGAYSASCTFPIGYQAVWNELQEMVVQSNPSTILQSVVTPSQSFAGARIANADAGDFWALITPTFNSGNATNRSVFVPLFYTSGLGTFNPATMSHYLEFRKAGSDPNTGDGVYYKSPSGTVKFDGISNTSKIVVRRTGGSYSFYNELGTGSGLLLLPLIAGGTLYTVTNSSPLSLTVHTKVINDGVTVAVNHKCNSSNEVYATLFDEVDGSYYAMKNGKLRFVFNQNYDTQNNLKFNIYNFLGSLQRTQANFPAVQATYGDNYITLDLTTPSGCLGEGIFVLEVISDKKEKTYLRFYNEYKSCTPEAETPPGGIGG